MIANWKVRPAKRPPWIVAAGIDPLRGRDELGVARRPEDGEEREQADEEPEVADAVRDEGLATRERLRLIGVPEPDEEVAAEADALPPDEGEHERVAEDEGEHRRDEQVQVREEPGEARVVLVRHVRGRVDVDERADAGDDHDHRPGEPVDEEAPRDRDDGASVRAAHPEPRIAAEAEHRVRIADDPRERDGRDDERPDHHADRDERDVSPTEPAAEDAVEDGAGEREENDGPQIGLCRCRGYDRGHRSGAKDYLLAPA